VNRGTKTWASATWFVPRAGSASANFQPRLAAARGIGRRPAIASQNNPVRLLIGLLAAPGLRLGIGIVATDLQQRAAQ
jgi:hypothetical protein